MTSAAAQPEHLQTSGDVARWRWWAPAAATLLGALLLFQVQPLVANAILPWFGGTPSVWTTSLLFFQTALVAGYAFVYVTGRFLSRSKRTWLQLALAAACTAALPVVPGPQWKPAPDAEPTLHVLILLTACVGAPYFLLATTGPLIQDWLHRAYPGRSPYRLYALSNLGSLVGLLAYPFLVERYLDLPTQSLLWSCAFVAYVVLLALAALGLPREIASPPLPLPSPPRRTAARPSVDAAPTPRQASVWLALAAGGTMLLLVTTNYLCQDISSDPLLWIVPLVLYLASFIIAFDHPRWYQPGWLAAAVLLIVPVACLPPQTPSFTDTAVANLVMLFAACMLCHGELARRRPHPRYLTAFYLWVAVGGALGGAFVAVVAPRIYERYWEWFGATLGAWLFAAAMLAAVLTKTGFLQTRLRQAAFLLLLAGGLATLLWVDQKHFPEHELAAGRNVYGMISIEGLYEKRTGRLVGYAMRSGSTQHGSQIFADDHARVPTAYYGVESGVGTALMQARALGKPLRVGVVGLGVGTMAAYGRPQDHYRFYEINPLVIQFAADYFTYLRDSRAACETLVGDARLTLEREPPQGFDLLALDAFSSDAIPKHLLTAEAIAGYLRHLGDDGILAVHISNKFMDLAPVLAAAAEHFQLTGRHIYTAAQPENVQQASQWVLLTRNPQSPWWRSIQHPGSKPLAAEKRVRLWTDAYSNILPLLR